MTRARLATFVLLLVGFVCLLASGSPARGEETKTKKDRGELTMRLGDNDWVAKSARWKMKKSSLKLTASRMDRVGESMVRSSLDLVVDDYAGPGTYTIAGSGAYSSLFLVVGFNPEAAGEGAEAEALKALSEAKTVRFAGAEVVIEEATDEQLTGSFTCEGCRPAVSEGKFRALKYEPRKKKTP